MKQVLSPPYSIPKSKVRLFLRSLALCIFFCLLAIATSGQGKIEKLADKVIHSGRFSVVGDILDVIEILEGGTSVKVSDLYEGEKLYANIGDLIQIPITIEFQHENTWDGRKEWVFFEYSIVLDGVEVAFGRIPEQGYYKDMDVGRVLKKDLWIGLDQWECKAENKRTLTVHGNVFDDAPVAGLSKTYGGKNDKKDPDGSTRKQKQWGMGQNPITHDTRQLASDSKSLQIFTLNPFYGTKPTEIDITMLHGEPIGSVHLARDLHWKPFAGGGKGVFSPISCDVVIDPLESLPPQWIWKMNLDNPATLFRGTFISVRYDGHHVEPDHWGETVSYTDFNGYIAKGKFNLPPTSKEFSDLLTAHWEKQSWSTVFLYGGIDQNNKCFPAQYKAFCRHDRDLSPKESDPALADRYKGDPVITPSGDDKPKKEMKQSGSTTDPAEVLKEWEKRGWTDPPGSWPDPKNHDRITKGAMDETGESGSAGDQTDILKEWEKRGWTDPPGSWPDLKDPDRITRDALKDTDTKKYNDTQKSIVIPQYALVDDIITGTVIIDSRERKKSNVQLFDVNPNIVTGLVTIDDEPVVPSGEAVINPSGRNAWIGWLAAVGTSAPVIKLLNEGRFDRAGNITLYPRSHIAQPMTDDMEQPRPGQRLDQIWDGNMDHDPEKVPPMLQYAPTIIEPGGTASFYGFFPNRRFPGELVPTTNPIGLEGIGLAEIGKNPADRSQLTELLPLASSSIEYRALVPANIPIDRFRVFMILANGEILPTEHITNVVNIISEGTPVLRANSRGHLSIRLQTPDNFRFADQNVQLYIENLTSEIIALDDGQQQTFVFDETSQSSATIPFTANRMGEYVVRIGVKEIADVITPEQAEWLISNRFHEDLINQFLRDAD